MKPLQRAPRRQWCSHAHSISHPVLWGRVSPSPLHCKLHVFCLSHLSLCSTSWVPSAGYEPSPVLYWPIGDYTIYISFVFVTPSLSDRIHLSTSFSSAFLHHFHQHTYAMLTEKTPLTPQFFPYHLISLLSFKLELLSCLYSVTSPLPLFDLYSLFSQLQPAFTPTAHVKRANDLHFSKRNVVP